MSNLRQFLKTVNLFSFRRRNKENGILFIFLLWILFVLLFNVSINYQSSETKTIFRTKNLLTDTKNLSETYSSEKPQNDNQNRRQRLLRSQCQSSQMEIGSESLRSKVTLLTDPGKTLGYCHVPKIATSSWMIVFALLNDLNSSNNYTNMVIEDNTLHNTVLRHFSLTINPDKVEPENEISFKFVFLRHPFERLVSAFYDKFVQDPDQLFVKSVVHHEPVDAEHLRWTFEKFEKEKKLKIKIQDVISFPRFVKFVLYELEQKKISHGTYHWIPYIKFCGICKIKYDFIGKLETLQNDLDYLKLKFPVEVRDKIGDIFALKKNAGLGKSHKTSEKYFKQLPKSLILKLYQVYKEDFRIGGYPYPEKYIKLGL